MSFSAAPPEWSAMDEPYELAPAIIEDFQAHGHTVVRGLASPSEVALHAPAIVAFEPELARRIGPLEERGTYGKAFLQGHNLWTRDESIKRFVFSARFARVAAQLLGVDGVRLYHDQSLTKEPGGGLTPWHQDQTYWPLDTDKTITMWMPLVDVPAEVGSMTFVDGSFAHGNLGPWIIGDESEAAFSELIARMGFSTRTHGALQAGDATFHRGWTLHSAPPNPTDLVRSVMTVIWYAEGTRVSDDLTGVRQFDHKLWLNGIPPGELADGPINPVLWPR